MLKIVILIVLAFLLVGCASSTNIYRPSCNYGAFGNSADLIRWAQ